MKRSSAKDQLAEWLAGRPFHAEQCCPDFSCCQPSLLAPEDERRLFVERPELRDNLCMGFLGRAMAHLGKQVHIAGSTEGEA